MERIHWTSWTQTGAYDRGRLIACAGEAGPCVRANVNIHAWDAPLALPAVVAWRLDNETLHAITMPTVLSVSSTSPTRRGHRRGG